MRCLTSWGEIMLVECTECKGQISDTAETCPHCGYPGPGRQASDATAPTDRQRPPLLLAIGAVALILSLFAPIFLMFFPIMVALGCAIASLILKERWRPAAVGVLVCGVVIFVLAHSGHPGGSLPDAPSSSDLASAEITDWNWSKDPDFGTHGTIKWNVSVHNVSSRPLRNVRVEFSTYDNEGKLVATTFTYVDAIPPGETRSDNSFADLYRTEVRAEVKITDVNFSD